MRVVDATWFLPGTERSARAEYEAAHIPGAVFFDLDAVCEPKGLHPHMVPSAAKFSSRVRKLGLGDGSRIVVYDGNRFFASARVWWLFRFMGHDDVMVLDGGLAKWRAEERPLTDMPTRAAGAALHRAPEQPAPPRARPDAREPDQPGASRWSTRARPGGSTPASRSRGRACARATSRGPGTCTMRGWSRADGTLKPAAELRRVLAEAGVDLARPVVTSCGSGVSAALINLALFELGVHNAALYDGSWAEWGAQADTPVAT